MNVVVAIQARTNSSRLPGKVLMPIGGYPLAVLAAKRAKKNSNYDVKVLTSTEHTDDHLCRILDENEIPFFRGDLDNVLSRFISAFTNYPDETVIVRLTADNIFPDANFIHDVIEFFIQKKAVYVCANGEMSGLPYGVSLEVTTLDKLREANSNTDSQFDQEHVTPYIRRNYGDTYYRAFTSNQFSALRCTIDSFDDYMRMTSLFGRINNPESISTYELIEKLAADNLFVSSEVSELVLGCVQLGLDYGINNKEGKPSQIQANNMLSEAVHSGVSYLDTARAYGNSEQVIGRWLSNGWKNRVKIITKLAPLNHLTGDSSRELIDLSVRHSVLESCHNLGLDTLDVLMLHRAEHLISHNGEVLKSLLSIKSEGVIQRLGVSVQSPDELVLALENTDVSFIQLPFNILDNRWFELIPKIIKIKEERELTIHVRSVFLQGLLLTDNRAIWLNIAGDKSELILKWLNDICIRYKCENIRVLAIKYVKSKSWVDALVLGTENISQLKDNIIDIKIDVFTEAELNVIDSDRPDIIDNRLLNPALWS